MFGIIKDIDKIKNIYIYIYIYLFIKLDQRIDNN